MCNIIGICQFHKAWPTYEGGQLDKFCFICFLILSSTPLWVTAYLLTLVKVLLGTLVYVFSMSKKANFVCLPSFGSFKSLVTSIEFFTSWRTARVHTYLIHSQKAVPTYGRECSANLPRGS
jgi:hypothetical protein